MLNCFLLLLAVVKTCIFHSNCYIHRLITSFVVHLCHFCQIVCFICFYNTSLLLLYVMGLIKIHCIHQNYTTNNTKSVRYCWLRRSLLFLVSHFIWGRRPSAIQNFIMLNCFLFLLAVVKHVFLFFLLYQLIDHIICCKFVFFMSNCLPNMLLQSNFFCYSIPFGWLFAFCCLIFVICCMNFTSKVCVCNLKVCFDHSKVCYSC